MLEIQQAGDVRGTLRLIHIYLKEDAFDRYRITIGTITAAGQMA